MLEDDLEMMEVVGNIFNSGWILGSGRWLQNLKQSKRWWEREGGEIDCVRKDIHVLFLFSNPSKPLNTSWWYIKVVHRWITCLMVHLDSTYFNCSSSSRFAQNYHLSFLQLFASSLFFYQRKSKTIFSQND
jgi:hypothetical protein